MAARKPHSIASLLLTLFVGAVIAQSTLFCAVLIYGGGLLTRTQDYAEQIFVEKVASRTQILHDAMQVRWSQMGGLADRFADLPYPAPGAPVPLEFWTGVLPLLREMLYSAGVNDAFVILTAPAEAAEATVPDDAPHAALYLRRADSTAPGGELLLLAGPDALAGQGSSVNLDQDWLETIVLRPETRDIYAKPLSLAGQHPDPLRLGYWHPPVSLREGTPPALTFSIPLTDGSGGVHGVLGIGVLKDRLIQIMPPSNLVPGSRLGCILAWQPAGADAPLPLIFGSSLPRRLLPTAMPLALGPEEGRRGVRHLLLPAGEDATRLGTVLSSQHVLQVYPFQTPFESDRWQIIGLIEENLLYSLPDDLLRMLSISLAASLLLGVSCVVAISRRLSRPVVQLSRHVARSGSGDPLTFPRTGLLEIDNLTRVIADANREITDTRARMLRIIEMANVPLGVFEIRRDRPGVQATDRLRDLLRLSEDEARVLYEDKERFLERLRGVMAGTQFRPDINAPDVPDAVVRALQREADTDEKGVFKVADDPEKWVRIHLVIRDGDINGVVADVTADVTKLSRMRYERDYDALTGLCSRTFFRRQVRTLLEMGPHLESAAMFMLDVDRFKSVNDRYGHQCGDSYLQMVARSFTVFDSPYSILGRRSGDEFFVFIFRAADRESVRAMARHLYRWLAENPFSFPDGLHCPMSLSLGIAWYRPGLDFDSLLAEADAALYAAKAAGRGLFREHVAGEMGQERSPETPPERGNLP